MKFLRVLAFSALALAATGAVEAKEWKKVVIATEAAFMPFNGYSSDGKLIGFEIDLFDNVCARMKITCEYLPTAWDGIIPGLLAGKYDAIMSGMSITEKRREVIDFSRNYTESPTTFAVLKTGPLANLAVDTQRTSLDDAAATDASIKALAVALKGKIIGVQVGSIQNDFMTRYLKGVVELRTYKTTEEHDLDLIAGRVDGVFASTSYFVSTLKKPGGDQIKLAGPLYVGGLMGKGAGLGLRKGDTDLRDMFDVAINAAIADGTAKRLSLKWFDTDITPPR